jgi:hypothetical protein
MSHEQIEALIDAVTTKAVERLPGKDYVVITGYTAWQLVHALREYDALQRSVRESLSKLRELGVLDG